ncbi:hypothetical protein, partial [Bradyrhizobium sp. NBAIM08]|uniref:hypothetical protein n=1 Tax=Bradyrhizobium sp. NBAIM08 TaxID=2793815 RepID=UPI001CD5E912
SGLDRLLDRVPDLPAQLHDNTVLARQLTMVLGASIKLAGHLAVHPEHLQHLAVELSRTSASDLRAELLHATGTDPDAVLPVGTDLAADDLRTAYRGALLRIAARDLCSPEPIEVVDDIADELSDLADATLEA